MKFLIFYNGNDMEKDQTSAAKPTCKRLLKAEALA
jgi:hypothetical protein